MRIFTLLNVYTKVVDMRCVFEVKRAFNTRHGTFSTSTITTTKIDIGSKKKESSKPLFLAERKIDLFLQWSLYLGHFASKVSKHNRNCCIKFVY